MALASSTGAQLHRAEIYSRDHRGRRIRRQRHHMDVPCTDCGTPRRSCTGTGRGRCCDGCMHPDVIPVRETRSWAPRPVEASPRETLEERTAREGRVERVLAELTPDERWVLEAQGKLMRHELRRREITAGEASYYLTHGYTLVGRFTAERNGIALECCIVEGYEEVQVERMDYAQMAAERGCSISAINKLVSRAHAKLRVLTF